MSAIFLVCLFPVLQSVPVADQCHDIQMKEPDECPAHIGPPCPPCYTNIAPDYAETDSLTFNSEEQQLLHQFMDWYIDCWSTHYPPSNASSGGYGIFSGLAGRANIHLRVYQYTKNETLLDIASEYINHALSLLPDPNHQQYTSYMMGNIGVWFLKAVIDQIKGDQESMQIHLSLIVDTFKSVDTAIMNGESVASNGLNVNDDCTLDTGLSGMVFGALLVNSYFDHLDNKTEDVIDPLMIEHLVFHILDIGMEIGQKLGTDYLQYESFENCYLYGPGHGSSGIIKSVLTAYDRYPMRLRQLMNESSKYHVALMNTVDFYASIQLEDGNIPTNTDGGCASHYGKDRDARVQWCHGAPGFIGIFLEASRLCESINDTKADRFMESAVMAMNATWNRGLLTKGTMFCHGIGGNLNMLWEASNMLRRMGHEKMANQAAWRTKQFILWTLDWDNIEATRLYQSDVPYSMFQGNFAMSMVYVEAMQSDWFSKSACHPGWNLCV